MPLARYALYAWGTELYAAPTWDRGEPWISTLRHIAKEGRCYVIGCCTPLHKDHLPPSLDFAKGYFEGVKDWLNRGDSLIADPDGTIVAGPAREEETILYAEVDRQKIVGPRSQLDVAGHYARPDIFRLAVRREPRPLLTLSTNPPAAWEPAERSPETPGA